MLNSIPCPSRRTILLSLLGLILLIITLQWLSRENLYEFLHEGEDAALIHHMGRIAIDEADGPGYDSYEDIPKGSPLYQEIMEILKSITIRPILLAHEGWERSNFQFHLCTAEEGIVSSCTFWSSGTVTIDYRKGDDSRWKSYRIVDEGRLKELYPLLGVPVPEQP